ncbi:tyrosine-type recombinase/integrase [Deinococcus yavapaiensis]|nr:site-specific integrase [Deinococcus yavapaiensis]
MAELHASSHRSAHDVLRRHLVVGDLESVLDLVAQHFPGMPGDRTRRTNVEGARLYLRWAREQQHSVLNADERVARAYHDHLIAKHGDATTSIANRLSHVRTLYRALFQLGAITINPFEALRQANPDRIDRREIFEDDELQRLLQHATLEERALVLVGAHAGLATREVLSLTWTHVHLDRGWIDLGRVIPLTDDAAHALGNLAKRRGHGSLLPSDERVFDLADDTDLRRRLYRLCRGARVPYRPWRALRNTAAQKLLMATRNPRRTAKRLGLRGTPRASVRKLRET